MATRERNLRLEGPHGLLSALAILRAAAFLVEEKTGFCDFYVDQRRFIVSRMNALFRPLEGSTVRLLPLEPELEGRVIAAVLAHPEVWRHIPYLMRTEADVRARLAQAAAIRSSGSGIVYATEHRPTGEIVGGTAILTVDSRVPSFEIGSTWVVPPFQRTRTNTEAKYLQLSFVFEELRAARVELKTDVRNERSRSAIARIGAREEGILRNHMRRADGTLRDSVLFSITLEEWPKVKQALAEKLAVT